MNDTSTGPFVVFLLFILRCLVPLAILFGISYLLQRFGLVDNRAELEKIRQTELMQDQTAPAKKPLTQKPTSTAEKKRKKKKLPNTPKKRSRTR
jgi:hypothetical protein